MVNEYLIAELTKEKNSLEQQIEIQRTKFDDLRKDQGELSFASRTFSQLCELEGKLGIINQELSEKYVERSECDTFVKKHTNTFRKFKENYKNTITYFKDNIHLSNMLFILFSFAFGIGLLFALWSWISDDSPTVASAICLTLLIGLCIAAYIVCNKCINSYCTNLAKDEQKLNIQRTVKKYRKPFCKTGWHIKSDALIDALM